MKTETKVGIALMVMVFGVLMIMNNVSAYDYEIEQGKVYDIQRPCFNNGTYCSGAAVCNITVSNPAGTVIVYNQRMTNKLSYHNYTLSSSQTQNLGTFNAIVTCTDGLLSGEDTFTINSSPMGSTQTLGFFFLIFALLYGLTLVGAYFDSFPIAVIGGMGLLALGIFTMTEGIDIYRNFATQVISFITIAVGAYFAIMGGVKIVQENM